MDADEHKRMAELEKLLSYYTAWVRAYTDLRKEASDICKKYAAELKSIRRKEPQNESL